jgi:hypothetical protein
MMKNVILIAVCVLSLGAPSLAVAQAPNDKPRTIDVQKAVEETQAIKTKMEQSQPNARFMRVNVQIELTLTDQIGGQPGEKKTVSLIASSGSWGKIRSAGTIRPRAEQPYPVVLNVDARPNVSADGSVQLELTFEYYPMRGGEPKEGALQQPSSVNQSQTVILQSGKPLIVSQAADPVSDRKVVVEVKATVLK